MGNARYRSPGQCAGLGSAVLAEVQGGHAPAAPPLADSPMSNRTTALPVTVSGHQPLVPEIVTTSLAGLRHHPRKDEFNLSKKVGRWTPTSPVTAIAVPST